MLKIMTCKFFEDTFENVVKLFRGDEISCAHLCQTSPDLCLVDPRIGFPKVVLVFLKFTLPESDVLMCFFFASAHHFLGG